MNSLSPQDTEYLKKAASGRIRPFGWTGWLFLLGPALFGSAVWMAMFGWTVHSQPAGTRAVLCLFDGAAYRASSQLSALQVVGIWLLLLLLGSMFAVVYVLRNVHNRLLRISKALNEHPKA
jgi:hypothetical protein